MFRFLEPIEEGIATFDATLVILLDFFGQPCILYVSSVKTEISLLDYPSLQNALIIQLYLGFDVIQGKIC